MIVTMRPCNRGLNVFAEATNARAILLARMTTTALMAKSALTVFAYLNVEVSPVVPTEIVQKSAYVLRAAVGKMRVFTTVMETQTILMQMENAVRAFRKSAKAART